MLKKTSIKYGRISLSRDDNDVLPYGQMTSIANKTNRYIELYPYGFSANAPEGRMLLSLEVLNESNSLVAIAFSKEGRQTGLKPGEAQISNEITKSRVLFAENGDVVIESNNNINVTVVGNVNINVAGTCTLTSSQVTINGDLRVSGDITDNYNTNSATSADLRNAYNNHTHISNGAGNPTSTTSNPV